MGYTEYFLGGIFGLYLIFFIIRTIVDIKKNKLLKAIKEEIKQITEKIDKKPSQGYNSMEIINKDLQKKIKEITFELIGKGEGL